MRYTELMKNGFQADDYRQYLAFNYGSVLTHGGMYSSYSNAMKHAKRLAKMIGSTVEEVIKTCREDYALISE